MVYLLALALILKNFQSSGENLKAVITSLVAFMRILTPSYYLAAEAAGGRFRRLPRTEGFEAVQLFFGILHELACADRTQVELIGVQSSDSTLPHSRRINKIVQFVEKNYHHKISLEDVGELVGMSASSVSRFFKQRTRHNFWDYLNGFRIDRAAQMMIETEHTISEISYACGFNNISNFNRVFRERIGTTPSDYRNKFKESIIPDR